MIKLKIIPFMITLLAVFLTTIGICAQETIKSASEYDYPPFSIVTEKGEADGFSVELLRASLKAVGLDVEFYVGPWAKIKQDLAEGKIQVLPLVGRSPERENIYDFSVPYITMYGGIFVRSGETSINTLKDLADKEVIVMKGDNAEEFVLRENVSKHIITTESFEDAFKMLSGGKHDAIVVQQTVGAQLIEKLGITNVIYISRIDKYKQVWTFAVKEGDKELLANLNDGLSKIIINGTFDIIHDKWFKKVDADGKIKIKLTPEEKAFIDEHPEITIAHTSDWPPYSFLDHNGQLVGPSIEFFELVAQKAGFKFTVHQDGLWNRIYEAGKNKEVDVVASMTITEDREQWFSFPRPYLFLSSYIITRKDFQGIKHRDDLKGKKLSGAKGTWQIDDVLKNYPSVKIDYVDTYSEALMKVSAGKADATVVTLGSALYDIARKGIYNLQLTAIYEKDTDLISFGVRKDWPELVSIIDKALAIIPEATKIQIINKWMPPLETPSSVYRGMTTSKEKIFEEKVIELIALGIAKEIDDYLEKNPQKTIEDLQNDEYFKAIATQQVGETGDTAVVDSQSGYFYFHPREKFVGTSLAEFEEDFNDLWKILESTRGEQCTESSGYYGWKEVEGEVTKKYLNTACIKNATADGKNLFVVASTYLTEIEGTKYLKKYDVIKTTFAEESIEQKAEDVARQIEIYMRAYPDKTLEDLQNDNAFQEIAVQPVGKTGYTTVSDYNSLVILFHPNKDFVGVEIETFSKDHPMLWELVKQAEGGNDIEGEYDFLDLNGLVKDKYLYIKIINTKTADGVGLWVAATTYLDEYDEIAEAKEPAQGISMIWFYGALILVSLVLFILGKLNIIKIERNAIMLFLSIALLLIIGLFVFNAYNISKNLKKTAINNCFDTLRSAASNIHVNTQQHITHMKGLFQIINSRKTISNEDLRKIVDLGEDVVEVFITDSDGKITHSSDLSYIGLSRLADNYLKNAKEKIYIKPLYRSSTIGEILFTIYAPYKEGFLVARINLHHVHHIISNKDGLGKSGESLLAYRNKNGDAEFFTHRKFITEAEARDIIPKKDVNIPITQALLGKQKEFSNYVDYRNVPVFSVTKYIDEIDAGLVVKIDQEEVFEAVLGDINQIWYSTAVIILAIIIIGVIFYFLLTHSLRKEVKSKTSALEKASIGLKKNITQLQTSERKLDKTLEKLNLATHSAQIAIWEWDIKNNHTFWSGKSEEALGFPSQAFGNNFETYMECVHPGDIDAINERVSHSLDQKLIVYHSEYRVIRPDGEIRWISSPGQVFYDPSGEPNRIAGIMIDITDRKKAEEERIVLETRLQQSQKMESIGTLAGGVAHEINNPINGIINYAQLIQDKIGEENPLFEYTSEIIHETERVSKIVKNLLVFARHEKESHSPARIQDIIDDTMSLIKTVLKRDQITLIADISEDLPTIKCRSQQIQQVVMNLITNARDALNEKYPDFDDNKKIEISSVSFEKGGKRWIRTTVEDRGLGLPLDTMERMFDPFYTTKDRTEGTGLGLFISYGIVKDHHGDLSVESEPGQYTRFHMDLPVDNDQELPSQL